MFQRILNLFRGFISLFVSGVEDANPRALLENEVNTFNRSVANYNQNLSRQGGLVERLKQQVAENQRQLEVNTAQAKAAAAAGSMERAGKFALDAKKNAVDLEENRKQLVDADTMFKDLTRQRDVSVKAARERINRVKAKIGKAEMAEANAKMAEMASVQLFDPNGGGLSKMEERLDERAALAAGKARVARDQLESASWIATEGEQKAMESAALAELLALGAPAQPTQATIIQPAQLPAPVRDAQIIDLGDLSESKVPTGTHSN